MKIIQFIQDFMTYTPPLISEATSLVGNVATIPVKMLGILGRINVLADDKQSGQAKNIVDVYSQYINIKMEKISIGDVMGGSEPEKPVFAQFNGNEKVYNNLKAKSDGLLTQGLAVFESMTAGIDVNANFNVSSNAEMAKLVKGYLYSFSPNNVSDTLKAGTSNVYTSDEIAELLLPKIKNYEGHKLTNTAPIYAWYTPEMFINFLNNTGINCLENYYHLGMRKNLSSKERDVYEYCAKKVSWIKKWSTAFPIIDVKLKEFEKIITEYYTLKDQMTELNKPSAY